MSLNDITLNSKVFSLRSVQAADIIRACTTATLPADAVSALFEISHDFSAVKANRSLMKFTRTLQGDDGTLYPISLHAVLTIPKGPLITDIQAQISGTGGMADDLSDFLALDTFASLNRIMNGEFS